jgi:5-methylcytosine-specific restriction enzyme subunit McrC
MRFGVSEVEALDHAQRVVGVEAFRWSARNQIKAAQHVGMVVAGEARLEILPKIEGLGIGETRRVLIQMIGIARDVPVRDGEITGHDYQDRDLLELLIGLFARRLQEQVRAGLSRAYDRHEDDISRLRGKMDVTRQFTTLAASPQKLACQYDEFTADIGLNRLLLCAVGFLRRRSVRSDTQRLLNEIAAHFEDVQSVSASDVLTRVLAFNRFDRRWEISATLAKLLLSSVYQTVHGGKRDGVALLFDMNLLFEAYVASLDRKVCAPLGYKVSTQGPQRCLARNEAGRSVFHTKPDLHVERDGDVVVLDTKWKHIDPRRPNFDVAQADAYQMHGYAHVYDSRATILLYPHHQGIAGRPGLQTRWSLEPGDTALIVATIDVTKPDDFATTLHSLLKERVAANPMAQFPHRPTMPVSGPTGIFRRPLSGRSY